FFASFCGLLYVCIRQRGKLHDPVLLAYILGMVAFIALVILYFSRLTQEEVRVQSALFTGVIMFSIIVSFIALGVRNRIPIFETFVDGAKEGFGISIKIIPFLVGMLVAIAVFRTSGVLTYIEDGVAWTLIALGLPAE